MARVGWIFAIAIALGAITIALNRNGGVDPPPAARNQPSPVAEPETPGSTGADPGVERVGETIAHPLAEKLLERELSAVPHVVVGAGDESPESGALGNIRSFVLVVEPTLDDAELEDLLRDVRARHRDAGFLIVKVFDSHEAAVTPRWVDRGAAASDHQVAELRRSPYREEDQMRVRGREIAP